MKFKIVVSIGLAALFLSGAATGQSLRIGSVFSSAPAPPATDGGTGARTDIDLTSFANATGSVSSVHIYWKSSCGDVKVKFFRRTGNSMTLTDQRALAFVGGESTISFAPVSVLQGDFVGVSTALGCGGPGAFDDHANNGHLQYSSDVTGTVDVAAGRRGFNRLAITAIGDATESMTAVLPIVGATGGAFGSRFTTSLQLFAMPFSDFYSGRLVLHPAGVAGTATDPTFSFTFETPAVRTYPDIMSSFGITGLGSIDLIVPANQTPPATLTRVYNDAGAAGTAGFIAEAIPAEFDLLFGSKILGARSFGVLVTPVEPLRTRFNIGVRSFWAGAQLTAVLHRANGSTVTVTKTYSAMYLEQVSASAFFGGVTIGGSEWITINVTDGNAIIYATTNDNVTNDPSIQFATVGGIFI